MDSKLLLVKAITLLYRESQLDNRGQGSNELVKEMVSFIRLPENSMAGDQERDCIVALRETALWMANNNPDYDYDKHLLLQRIRVDVGYNTGLYDAVETGLQEAETEEETKRICLEYREVITNFMKRDQIKEVMKRVSQQLMFNEETVDWKNFVPDVISELEPYAGSTGHVTNTMGYVDFSDEAALLNAFEKASEEVSNEGTLKTGWQGINRMTGEHDGARRGEFIVVGALQHNFKTGFTLNLFKHFAMYNTPYMRDPSKKPLLIHLSLENNLTDNLIWLYKSIKENETKEQCNINHVDPVEASRYVKEHLTKKGYHIKMLRENPSDFTFRDLFNMIEGLEAEGYEVHAIVCDYLNMMSKKGCTSGGPSGDDIRDLFRRVRNFCTP